MNHKSSLKKIIFVVSFLTQSCPFKRISENIRKKLQLFLIFHFSLLKKDSVLFINHIQLYIFDCPTPSKHWRHSPTACMLTSSVRVSSQFSKVHMPVNCIIAFISEGFTIQRFLMIVLVSIRIMPCNLYHPSSSCKIESKIIEHELKFIACGHLKITLQNKLHVYVQENIGLPNNQNFEL